jgi:hypothetical protein
MEGGEESGIEVGWRVNEGGEEKAPGGVRKKRGRPAWAEDWQPPEGRRGGEKAGMAVPEQPGELEARGGRPRGPRKGRRGYAWLNRRAAWPGSGGVGEPIVCRKRRSEDGAAGPRGPECECVARSRRDRGEAAAGRRTTASGERKREGGQDWAGEGGQDWAGEASARGRAGRTRLRQEGDNARRPAASANGRAGRTGPEGAGIKTAVLRRAAMRGRSGGHETALALLATRGARAAHARPRAAQAPRQAAGMRTRHAPGPRRRGRRPAAPPSARPPPSAHVQARTEPQSPKMRQVWAEWTSSASPFLRCTPRAGEVSFRRRQSRSPLALIFFLFRQTDRGVELESVDGAKTLMFSAWAFFAMLMVVLALSPDDAAPRAYA